MRELKHYFNFRSIGDFSARSLYSLMSLKTTIPEKIKNAWNFDNLGLEVFIYPLAISEKNLLVGIQGNIGYIDTSSSEDFFDISAIPNRATAFTSTGNDSLFSFTLEGVASKVNKSIDVAVNLSDHNIVIEPVSIFKNKNLVAIPKNDIQYLKANIYNEVKTVNIPRSDGYTTSAHSILSSEKIYDESMRYIIEIMISALLDMKEINLVVIPDLLIMNRKLFYNALENIEGDPSAKPISYTRNLSKLVDIFPTRHIITQRFYNLFKKNDDIIVQKNFQAFM
jgi:hypothetical protein